MADREDDAQRTEEPTPKRLEDARKKGDAPKSQELIAAVMLAAGLLALVMVAGPVSKGLAGLGATFLDHPHEFAVDGGALQRLFGAISGRLALIGGGALLLLAAAALLANFGQARPVFSPSRLALQFAKLSPLAGLKRIYGASGLFNFLKGVFKILIIGAILVYALWPDRALLVGLAQAGTHELLAIVAGETGKMLALAAGATAVLGVLDYAHQRRLWIKRLRMTKEEVKRELKESEGDPLIKGRLRRERDARSRRRMLAAVKDATVLIMNPTHVAVALKYEAEADRAPVCVAKGADEVALRMRAAANDNSVPVVENPTLARALFESAELDQEIPVEHYEAVANVIGFIMKKAESVGS
jgi:flagellar biosynthetic protein FlhB